LWWDFVFFFSFLVLALYTKKNMLMLQLIKHTKHYSLLVDELLNEKKKYGKNNSQGQDLNQGP
jgi:hypothetical protein